MRLVEAAKERTLNRRRSSTGGRSARRACHANAPNRAAPAASGASGAAEAAVDADLGEPVDEGGERG